MGHEIIQYRNRHVIVPDFDSWALRHFLLVEAQTSGNAHLEAFIQGWEWIGPGIYMGIDFATFFNEDASRERSFCGVLSAARKRLQSFGMFVPLEYIAENINSSNASFTEARPVKRWVSQIDKLRELFLT